jgi:hypothetical protein
MGTGRLPWACPTAERASSRNEPPNRPRHSIVAIERTPERISFQPLSVLKVGRLAFSVPAFLHGDTFYVDVPLILQILSILRQPGVAFLTVKFIGNINEPSQRHAPGNLAFPRQKKMTRGNSEFRERSTSKDQHSMQLKSWQSGRQGVCFGHG